MSADIDRNDVLTAMRGIDLYKDVPETAIKLERLGGLTNRNYRIDSPRGRHVLRIPGAGTSEYINRKNEAHAARSAAKVGVRLGPVPGREQPVYLPSGDAVVGGDDAGADQVGHGTPLLVPPSVD